MPQQRRRRPSTGLRMLGLLLALPLLAACDLPWTTSPTPTPLVTIEGGTPVALAAGAWQRIALPAPAQDVDGYAVSPTAPDTLFACTDEPAPRTLWHTTDAGAHWTRFGLLAGPGSECQFSFAPDDPRDMGVQVTEGQQTNHVCAGDTFYLSVDGGAVLHRLPTIALNIPASAPYDHCALAVTRDHLFLTYAASDPRSPGSLLARSDDGGNTWARIDGTLGDDTFFFTPQFGPGDRLAMTALHSSTPPTAETAVLWTSTNAGDTWTKASDLPDSPGNVLLSSWPASGTAWPQASQPFYALISEQLPSDLYRERVLASTDGAHWSLLPNLPVPGVSGERHGIHQVLAALPDGRLAVWGVDPQVGVPGGSGLIKAQTSFWLWLWDSTSGVWQVVTTPLDVTARDSCGLCWQGNASGTAGGPLSLYTSHLFGQTEIPGATPVGLYRLRIPAA